MKNIIKLILATMFVLTTSLITTTNVEATTDTYNSGKVIYIPEERWNEMSDSEKAKINKIIKENKSDKEYVQQQINEIEVKHETDNNKFFSWGTLKGAFTMLTFMGMFYSMFMIAEDIGGK